MQIDLEGEVSPHSKYSSIQLGPPITYRNIVTRSGKINLQKHEDNPRARNLMHEGDQDPLIEKHQ